MNGGVLEVDGVGGVAERVLRVTKHIGIVGVSPEGAALFHRQISRHASRLLPPSAHPRITLHNEPLAQYIDALRRQEWEIVAQLLRRSAELVVRCGAQLVTTPDNVVIHAVHMAQVGSPVPWVTMPDLVAKAIMADGKKKVGIVGTKLVTESSTYQTPLGLHGIHVFAPEPAEADLIEEIIFGELIYGHARPESRAAMIGVVNSFAQRGCDGVILASSEVPLVVTPETTPLKLYDPLDILAEGAVRAAMA